MEMKKLCWILVSLLFLATNAWAQFYQDLSGTERQELAEAYYLVGAQYSTHGDEDKGAAFKQMAFNIDPHLKAGEIKPRELPSAVALIMQGEARVVTRLAYQKDAVKEMIRSKFIRLVSAVLTEDIEATLILLDGSVYLGKENTAVGQDEIRTVLKSFFSSINLSGLSPSEVYDLNSLNIDALALHEAWGETYALNIKTRQDLSGYIDFWEDQQQFLIHRTRNRWLLFSVGRQFPPSHWSPEEAPTPAPRTAAPPGPGQDIKKRFLACLDAFLVKDVDQAVRYFAEDIHLARLNTNLSSEEMASTFQGYFENSDFTGITPDDVLETTSIFVEETDKYTDLATKPVYLLTVKTNLDLSDRIPFWTRFQDYFFARSAEDGTWKIFAIF